jgi:hypothetical protein
MRPLRIVLEKPLDVLLMASLFIGSIAFICTQCHMPVDSLESPTGRSMTLKVDDCPQILVTTHPRLHMSMEGNEDANSPRAASQEDRMLQAPHTWVIQHFGSKYMVSYRSTITQTPSPSTD